ncbi:unnamed protein product [Rotaria socialis]|uniref:EF-hand domain-containing protein n=1 Tax=Rotaria socialis TaxID=392032 RepID=A0A821KS34_9BILA|nr:unnamed protein product [Rotaria socialis]CAF4517738.1 unnamed protein product [Rotaria socialis]CAF4738071.1 unnamed protein product [Rotaria socialis]
MPGLTDEILTEIRDVFSLYDDRGDHQIPKHYLGEALRALGLNPTEAEIRLTLADLNRIERLSMQQFQVIFERLNRQKDYVVPAEEFIDGLRVFDKDGNGLIPATELRHLLTTLGAGPAGIQLAYFLHKAKRDYIAYERSSQAGSFFINYPRHRQLISINKRNTGEKNRKFNLRHDWNSLLSNDDHLRFTHRSKKLFPSADLMVNYLNDFYRHHNLHIQLNITIKNLKPISEQTTTCSSKDCSFLSTARFRMNDQYDNSYTCGIVIVATGLSIPNIPPIDGIDLAVGYENVSLVTEEFENKSVLILGRGNAAFEVAQHIYDATNYIHMISRSRVRNAYATHYVGDLRAINNQLLDTYQLKSLDALVEIDLMEHELLQNPVDGRIQIKYKISDTDINIHERQEAVAYDKVIRCLGFKFDDSIWHPDVKIEKNLGRTNKYPKIQFDYQSFDYDHLYFTGTLMHSIDFRKSSGGFIHGFRYLTQTLYRIFEYRYHENKWPSITFSWYSLTNYLIKRMNEADGIYQMFGQLVDVILIDRINRQCRFIEEYPARLLPRLEEIAGYRSENLLILNMQYGMNYSGAGRDVFAFDRVSASVDTADRSNFLHPVLYYYDSSLEEIDFENVKAGFLPLTSSTRIHHIIENVLTSWMEPTEHILPLRIFLENILHVNLQQQTVISYARKKMLQQKLNISVRVYSEM